ncbi:nitrate reductase molybdenum cofactor assembly chaperone [Sphingorhabdus sp. IMCC26285]|uniref:Nitrate reductase molybdenum cofactor assembly chaperone n=1 Tax=Sphingorhabdus profundilacus TaxID=2509718 RepID=A0A6I4LYY1_9SPHN|nr:nitrate reductase molybdenum cofactor assembly chaperone [Sphingorhabdus profundilacus]MVZ97190.1 nitrate reductase molybdenum cofactor assembly chaperone [Sphingorhabdus profundilacus]
MSMITLRALSALLHYPDENLRAAVPDIRATLLVERIVSEKQMLRLDPLLFRLSGGDLIALQEHYVELFDRGRTHSLHLFEYVHGESRDRGQAMVDLRERYIEAGLDPATNELPDYLPLFLEYCSTLPRSTALTELAEAGTIIATLAERLESRGTDYAGLLGVLRDLSGDQSVPAEALTPVDDPNDLEALDAAWEEEEITFGAMAPAAPLAEPACPISNRQILAMQLEQGA